MNQLLRTKSGFTLVELLLATALVAVIGFAIFGNFASGARIWKTLQQDTVHEDVNIFYEKAAQDFEGTFKYAGISFFGDKEKVSFAAFMQTRRELGGDHGIGQINYHYDAERRAIVRDKKDVNELYRVTTGQADTVLSNVTSFKISYFWYDPANKLYQWDEGWDPTKKGVPVAVRFNFELLRLSKNFPFSQTFYIPTGG